MCRYPFKTVVLSLMLLLFAAGPSSADPFPSIDDGLLYVDPLFRFSMSYSDKYVLKGVTQIQAERKASGKTDKTAIRMTLRAPKAERRGAGARLVFSVMRGPRTVVDNQEYCKFVFDEVTGWTGSRLKSEPRPAVLNETEFYTLDVDRMDSDKPFRTRVYCRYDSESRLGYFLTLNTTNIEDAEAELALLEQPLQTLRLARLPVAPSEKRGPAALVLGRRVR